MLRISKPALLRSPRVTRARVQTTTSTNVIAPFGLREIFARAAKRFLHVSSVALNEPNSNSSSGDTNDNKPEDHTSKADVPDASDQVNQAPVSDNGKKSTEKLRRRVKMGLKKARRLGNNNLVASGLSGGADGASGDAAPPIRSIPVADVQKTLQQLEVLNKGLNEKLHRALGKLNVKSADLNLSFKTFPYLLDTTLREILELSAYRYLTIAARPSTESQETTSEEYPTPVAPPQTVNTHSLGALLRDKIGFLLLGDRATTSELYMESLARAVAAHYNADFIDLDINRISMEQHTICQFTASEKSLIIQKYERRKIASVLARQRRRVPGARRTDDSDNDDSAASSPPDFGGSGSAGSSGSSGGGSGGRISSSSNHEASMQVIGAPAAKITPPQQTSNVVAMDAAQQSPSGSTATTATEQVRQQRNPDKLVVKNERAGGGAGGAGGNGGGSGSANGNGGRGARSSSLPRLAKHTGDLPKSHLWHALITPLFEMVARDPSRTPRIVFLRQANLLSISQLEYLQKVKTRFASQGIPIIFIGSVLETQEDEDDDDSPNDPMAFLRRLNSRRSSKKRTDDEDDEGEGFEPEEEDDGADAELDDLPPIGPGGGFLLRSRHNPHHARAAAHRQALADTFSQTIAVRPPTEPKKREKWNIELAAQNRERLALSNSLRITDALHRANLKLAFPTEEPSTLSESASKLRDLLLDSTTEVTAPGTPNLSHHNLTTTGGDLSAHKLTRVELQHIVEWAYSHAIVSNRADVDASDPSNKVTAANIAYAFDLLRRSRQPKPSTGNTKLDVILGQLNEHERELRSSVVASNSIDTTFSDIGALDNAKKELESLFTPFKLHHIFQDTNPLIKVPSGVLLYGPPGTGKTMLARAIARQSGAAFIHISPSNINSKWFGQAERNVAAVFTLAAKLSPTIVFIDEVDSFLSSRSSSDHEATSRIKTEFMTHWDGLKNNNEQGRSVIVMGATNRPFDLDLAVLRRLPHRILVDLPDRVARASIIGKVLANVVLDVATLPTEARPASTADEAANKSAFVAKIASMTEGYSGSDLHNLCSTAANMIVRDILADKDYNPEASLDQIQGVALKHATRALTFKDFEMALLEVKPSVDDNDRSIGMLRTWQKSFGQVKKTSIGF